MFFTNKGKVYWRRSTICRNLARDSRGWAVVNLLNLAEGERSPIAGRSAISTSPTIIW